MQLILKLTQPWKAISPRVLGRVLAIGILLAVPTLGLAHLSQDLFVSWQGRGSEERVLAGEGFLPFEAPTSTLRQHQLRVNNSSSVSGKVDGLPQPSLLIEDWQFTAQSTNLTPTINNMVGTLKRAEFLSDAYLSSTGVPSSTLSLVMLQQHLANQTLNRDLVALSHITTVQNLTMINGFLGNLILQQAFFDNLLVSTGISPTALSSVLAQQLGFNEAAAQYFVKIAQQALESNVQPTPPQPASPSR